MKYTLWSKGQLLGSISGLLPGGVPVSGLAPGTLAGLFHPTEAFATMGAPLLAFGDATQAIVAATGTWLPSPGALEGLAAEERGRKIYDALHASPIAQRLTELQAGVDQLQLQLRDDTGLVVPTRHISVGRFPPVAGISLEELREDASAGGMEVSDLILVAMRSSAAAGAA